MSNICKVVTFVQATFHFEKGEIISTVLSDKLGAHINKVDQDTYEVIVVPHIGRSSVYVGNAQATKDLVEDEAFDWYVVKGASLEETESLDVANKLVGWVQDLLSSIFRRGA